MTHAGKNVVIVLALVAAGFFAAWLRFRPYLGSEGRYTDGVRTYDVSDAGEVRYAVWDRPEGLPGEVNSGENERRPALSPDGRLMVFVVGARGLGADLYVAEMDDGVARDPRPLDSLNSVADEWSPSFGPGGLYFASDRPGSAGGLDLWRAPYALGSFGEPERLQGGVNSSADDTDPAAIPGSGAVVFASNRKRQRLLDYDLYVARPRVPGEATEAAEDAASETDAARDGRAETPDGLWEVEPLLALNSRFDEREPAFTADGRNLFFASDRTGGYGDFDLYRSALGAQGWIAPEVLAGVNSAGAEHDPLPSRDGFELLFTSEEPAALGGAHAHADVRRARSLELFRTPGRPVGWKDLLILGILLLLAILAWLARQWEQLEVLYKCVLISLVIHLLLMWWFRDVYPEGTEYELRGGDSDRIRVRLVSNPAGGAQANAERGGDLEVARAESEPSGAERRELETAEAASGAAPAAARLERARSEAVASPVRDTTLTTERASTPSAEAPAVRQAESDFQRMAEGAQAMSVAEPGRAAPAERADADARQAELESVPDAAQASSHQAPRSWTLERATAGAALPDAPTARAIQHVPEHAADSPADATRVAQPRESVERRAQAAPELAVQAGRVATRAARGTPAATRDAELGEDVPDTLRAATASAAERSALEIAGAGEAAEEPTARAATEFERTQSLPSQLALAEIDSETFERLQEDRRAEQSLLADAPGARARPDARNVETEIGRATAALPERSEPLDVAPRRLEALERATAGAALPDAPTARAIQHAPERVADSPADATRVAQPRESVQRRAQAAPELALRAGSVATRAERGTPEATRDVELGEDVPDTLRAAAASAAERSALEIADAGEAAEESAARAATEFERTQSRPSQLALAEIDSETFERLQGDSRAEQSLLADAPGERARPDVRNVETEIGRATAALPERSEPLDVAPRRLEALERATAGVALPDAPTARAIQHAPERVADSPADATRVAQPRESVQRRAQAAPELALRAGSVATRAERGTPEATRDVELGEDVPDTLRAAAASAAERSALEIADAGEAAEESAARAATEFERTQSRPSRLALAKIDSETFERLQGDSRAEQSLLADAPGERARPDVRNVETEIARATAARPERAEPLDVAPRRLEALERSVPEDTPAPAPFRAAHVTPDARGERRDVSLAEVTEDVRPLRGEDASELDAELESGIERELADSLLALEASDRVREDRADGPRRFERSAPRELDSPAPSFRPLATGERAEDDTVAALTRWDHTPYQSRSGEQKARAIDLHGGSEATEAAVAAGLRYLASRQRAEGNFGRLGDRHDKYHYVTVGKTGLVLLAFMGAGHTQDSNTEHSLVVMRAIAFLLAMQDEDSGHFGYSSSYSHAIATYALAECYALTKDQHLRAPIERAVAHILRNQVDSEDPRFDGGWGYYFPDGRTFDRWPRASVTAWQVMALESARLGGLPVPDRAFDGAHDFLVRCWDAERGAFRYSHDPERLTGDYPVLPGSTPASMFALSLMGEDIGGRPFRAGRSFLLERTPRVYRYTSDDDFVFRAVGNLYFWYYSTLALFRVGGRPWEAWNEGMKGALLPAQEDNGSWRPISIYAIDYAYDRDDDRVYTTAMCVLTLEVYYRYFTPLLKVD